MALILDEDFQFKTVQAAFEKAGLIFSRLNILANTAIVMNDYKDGDFENPLYRQDCLYYQLEAIRDLSKQFETLFDDVAMTLGRRADSVLKAADSQRPESVELLPENAAHGVLSGVPETHQVPRGRRPDK
jgi:hypothetical protein